jgi:hypothetical protein
MCLNFVVVVVVVFAILLQKQAQETPLGKEFVKCIERMRSTFNREAADWWDKDGHRLCEQLLAMDATDRASSASNTTQVPSSWARVGADASAALQVSEAVADHGAKAVAAVGGVLDAPSAMCSDAEFDIDVAARPRSSCLFLAPSSAFDRSAPAPALSMGGALEFSYRWYNHVTHSEGGVVCEGIGVIVACC